jgi:hypothetical protein
MTSSKSQTSESDTLIKNGYASGIKKDWWVFWQGTTPQECITVSASNDPGYRPNFCYEKEWDKASKAEVGLAAVEVAAGTAAAVAAGYVSGGTGALPAYCLATTGLAFVDAWILAGTMANDKWPHGIEQ